MEETLEQISPILPMDFYNVSLDLFESEKNFNALKSRKYKLPIFSELLFEDPFADVFMGWNAKGLAFCIKIDQPFSDAFFPEYRKGDSIELFIDTRDIKSSRFPHRFCHQFLIFPQVVDSILAQEITSFRTEDRHELCQEELIEVISEFSKGSYFLKIFIPSECLHGYDPILFDRLGFSYRINRFGGAPQHFAVSSDYLNIENQPSLWGSMQMRKK